MRYFFGLAVLFLMARIDVSYAQNDFFKASWISAKGDSVHGFVKQKIISNKYIHVKESEEAKQIRKSADELTEVYKNNDLIFSSYTILYNGSKHKIFIELISKGGEVGLYHGTDTHLGDIYLIKKNNQFTTLNRNDLASSYSYLYGDCDMTVSEYTYSQKNILSSFESYLTCLGKEISKDFDASEKDELAFYLGPLVGFGYGNFIQSEESFFSNGDYSAIQTPILGINLDASFNQKFIAQTELSYYKKKSSSDSVMMPISPITDKLGMVDYDLSFMGIGLTLGYKFLLNSKVRPLIGGGFHFGILLAENFSYEFYEEWAYSNEPPQVDFSNSNESGFLFFAGMEINSDKKNISQILLRYNFSKMVYGVNEKPDLYSHESGSIMLNSQMFEISYIYLIKL